MKCKESPVRVSLRLSVLLLLGTTLAQFATITAASEPIALTVTAVGKTEHATGVSRDDVELFVGNERKQIGDWTKSSDLFLAILI